MRKMSHSEICYVFESNDDKTTTKDANISKLRQAVPQCCAIAVKNLLLLTFGSSLGFLIILIPALQEEDSDIQVTTEELTWISSLNLFLVAFGCLVSGPISQYLGRKRMMMLTSIQFAIAWLIFYYASKPAMLFIALAIAGLMGGLLKAPVLTYVAEVTQPNLRGMLSATSSVSIFLGIFTQMLSGSLAHWRMVAIINLIYPVLCFFALCLVPESPLWLAAKGRFAESERALCWLRGWVDPSQVQNEFQTICETVQKPATDSTDSEKKEIWRHYTKRTFYLPFILVTGSFFINSFGGGWTLQTFAVVIFAKLKTPIDKYTATVFMGVAQLVATIICVLVIRFLGKRKLAFISVGGTGLCFFATAVYGFLNEANYVDEARYTWLPTTLMIGVAFMSSFEVRLLPWVFMSEVYPTKVRSSATGASSMIGFLLKSIANKTFLYMMNGTSLSVMFIFYALVNVAGLCFLYMMLPETENRTLTEIEEHFAGIQNLKHRKGARCHQGKVSSCETNNRTRRKY